MKNMQLTLADIQGDFVCKEEFYQIAHIGKGKALWLIETGRVAAEKPEKKGLGYKIPKEEVERYLLDRQRNPQHYCRNKRYNRFQHVPEQPYSSEIESSIRSIVEQETSFWPDLLTEQQVCMVLGYEAKKIIKWRHEGKLLFLYCDHKVYYPKIALLDFVSSEYYYYSPYKGKKHIELLRRAQNV